MKYDPNNKLRFLPDVVGTRKRGGPKKANRMKSVLEMATKKGRKIKERKRRLRKPLLDGAEGAIWYAFKYLWCQTLYGRVDSEGVVAST